MKAKAERIPALAALALPIAGLHNLLMHVSTSHLEIKLNASFQRYGPPARGFQHRPAQKDKVEKKCPCYNDGVESCAKSFANQGVHQLTRELLTQVDVMYLTQSCNMRRLACISSLQQQRSALLVPLDAIGKGRS